MNAITHPDTGFKLTPQQTAQAIIDLFTQGPDIHDQSSYLESHGSHISLLDSARPLPDGVTMCTATAACYVNGYDVIMGTPLARRPDDTDSDWNKVDIVARDALGLDHDQSRTLFLFSNEDDALATLRQIVQGGRQDADH